MIRAFFALAIASNLSAAEPPAGDLLDRAEKQVERFWDQFSAVHCNETLSQVKLDPRGKQIVEKHATFDYLVLMQINNDELSFEESRVEQGKPPRPGDRALLTTSGFSTLILIFHPHFRNSFQFTTPAGQEAGGPHIHFTAIHGRRTPAILQLRNREYPIEWEGDAWIDVLTGAVTRIRAGLATPMQDLGLQKLEADVVYRPVELKGRQEQAWLPATATIEAETQHQHWLNRHTFSDYKEFGVGVESSVHSVDDDAPVNDNSRKKQK